MDDSTCPAHYRENALQNQVLDLQAQNAQLLQSQDKIWGAADENLCAEYDAKIDDINEVLSDALEMVDIARQALQVIGSGHVFDSADDAEKWARDLANNALEEMSK